MTFQVIEKRFHIHTSNLFSKLSVGSSLVVFITCAFHVLFFRILEKVKSARSALSLVFPSSTRPFQEKLGSLHVMSCRYIRHLVVHSQRAAPHFFSFMNLQCLVIEFTVSILYACENDNNSVETKRKNGADATSEHDLLRKGKTLQYYGHATNVIQSLVS